jgi:hypothetical protein
LLTELSANLAKKYCGEFKNKSEESAKTKFFFVTYTLKFVSFRVLRYFRAASEKKFFFVAAE